MLVKRGAFPAGKLMIPSLTISPASPSLAAPFVARLIGFPPANVSPPNVRLLLFGRCYITSVRVGKHF